MFNVPKKLMFHFFKPIYASRFTKAILDFKKWLTSKHDLLLLYCTAFHQSIHKCRYRDTCINMIKQQCLDLLCMIHKNVYKV